MWKRWAENTGASVLAVVILSFIPGGVVAYLAKMQSEWTKPFLLGLSGWVLGTIIVLAMDAIRRLPPRRIVPSLTNIEQCVRDWLDNFGVAVKRDPVQTAFFRFIVTMDSSATMIVGRIREGISDYLIVRANLPLPQSQLDRLNLLTDKARQSLIFNIRLELAHLKVGYAGLDLPATDFHIMKRIPIRPTLTEHEFIGTLDEIEAAITSIAIVFELKLEDAESAMHNSAIKTLS